MIFYIFIPLFSTLKTNLVGKVLIESFYTNVISSILVVCVLSTVVVWVLSLRVFEHERQFDQWDFDKLSEDLFFIFFLLSCCKVMEYWTINKL